VVVTERNIQDGDLPLTAVALVVRRSRIGRWNEVLTAATVVCCLALLAVFVSTNLTGRFDHRTETIQQQFAILAGGPYPINGEPNDVGAYQNRVLFPFVLRLGTSVGIVSVGEWYLLLRLATAAMAFLVVWWLLRAVAQAQPRLAIIGLGLLTYELIFTFSQGWEHPTDFPDIAITGLWVWAALSQRKFAIFFLSLLAAFNRESAAFAGVLWIALYGISSGRSLQPRQIGFGMLLSVASYATVLAIRWSFGGFTAVIDNTNVSDLLQTLPRFGETLRSFLAHPTPWSWPVLLAAMAILPLGWIWANRISLGLREKRMLLAAAAVALLSLPFSSLDEPRDFTTSIVLLIFVAVAAEAGRHHSQPQLDVSRN